jgi:hypothetical protein
MPTRPTIDATITNSFDGVRVYRATRETIGEVDEPTLDEMERLLQSKPTTHVHLEMAASIDWPEYPRDHYYEAVNGIQGKTGRERFVLLGQRFAHFLKQLSVRTEAAQAEERQQQLESEQASALVDAASSDAQLAHAAAKAGANPAFLRKVRILLLPEA